jgi:hypothetical protein
MERLVRYLVIITVIIVLIWGFQALRTEIATQQAARYAPAAVQRTIIPSGTQFQVLLRDGIAESTRSGDSILGFVSAPVVINGEVTIPAGTVLQGVVEEIAAGKKQATVRLDFHHLLFHDREFDIKTESVMAKTVIVSDFTILSSALQTATGAATGAAMGAATKNEAMIGSGLVGGALAGVAPSLEQLTPITLVLKEPLELCG